MNALATIQDIKLWRVKNGVSQQALATRAGFSRNTYAAWENNRRKPNTAAIVRLCSTIFAWGENDYITTPTTPVMVSSTPTAADKPKKSLLWYAGYFIGKTIRFILKTLCIVK